MQASTQDGQSNKGFQIRRDLLQTILLVVIVIGLSAGAGYLAGFQMGKKEGARLAVKKVTDFINPLNAISDSPLTPGTVLGQVNSINDSSVTVKMANGKEKTVVITNKTTVTQGDKTLSVKDVKEGANVTVLTQGKDKDTTATRIVVR